MAYRHGKSLTNAAQHGSYPKTAWYGRAGIRTHDPVVGYFVWLRVILLAGQNRPTPDGSDRPTAIVSKAGADAQIECMSSYKPQQPQPFSNISLPLARDYSPCKDGKLSFMLISQNFTKKRRVSIKEQGYGSILVIRRTLFWKHGRISLSAIFYYSQASDYACSSWMHGMACMTHVNA